MRDAKRYLISGVITAILCIPAVSEIERPFPGDKPVLLGRANPTLAGIEQVYVTIVLPDAEPNKDGLVFHELTMKVINKLHEAGIKMVAGVAGSILEIDELRVYIDMLKLADSQQYVFRIQTSLARKVILPEQPKLGLKADVWKITSAMEAIPVQCMPDSITNVVLEQTEAFITAWLSANPPERQPSDVKTSDAVSPTTPKQAVRQTAAEYNYIASKNSEVFHKIGCSAAGRIKPENLIRYTDRAEAIKAGKRPCKRCKP
jgi:hypothetical protein